jgi:hypothetical protein
MNAVFLLSEYLDPTVLLCMDPDPSILPEYLYGCHTSEGTEE